MGQSILSNVGASLVPVLAGALTFQVSIKQTPGGGGAFQVYDVNQNLLQNVVPSGTGNFQWNAPQVGDPFSPGQTVGYVAVAAGTQNFIVSDTNLVKYTTPPSGGVYAADGAIGQRSGRVFLTKATAAAMTIGAPIPGVDDFKEIEIVNQSQQAHVITAPTNAFDGSTHICTMTAGPGVVLVMMAFNGVWYSQRATGNGLAFT